MLPPGSVEMPAREGSPLRYSGVHEPEEKQNPRGVETTAAPRRTQLCPAVLCGPRLVAVRRPQRSNQARQRGNPLGVARGAANWLGPRYRYSECDLARPGQSAAAAEEPGVDHAQVFRRPRACLPAKVPNLYPVLNTALRDESADCGTSQGGWEPVFRSRGLRGAGAGRHARAVQFGIPGARHGRFTGLIPVTSQRVDIREKVLLESYPQSRVAQRQSVRLLIGRLLVRIQPRELFFIWHPSITKCRG